MPSDCKWQAYVRIPQLQSTFFVRIAVSQASDKVSRALNCSDISLPASHRPGVNFPHLELKCFKSRLQLPRNWFWLNSYRSSQSSSSCQRRSLSWLFAVPGLFPLIKPMLRRCFRLLSLLHTECFQHIIINILFAGGAIYKLNLVYCCGNSSVNIVVAFTV